MTGGPFDALPARPALTAGASPLPIEAADAAIAATTVASEIPGETLNWDLVQRVACRFAGHEPLANSYLAESLSDDFDQVTRLAEGLVAEETGLVASTGPAQCRVIDRREWIEANVSNFKVMMGPLAERMAAATAGIEIHGPAAWVARLARDGTRAVVSIEMGAVLGFVAQRVLGQYDLFLPEEGADAVYYVGANVLSLEKKFEFVPRDFRFWIALHELTHRAQFTGVPWMRPYFVELVDQTFTTADPDPRRLVAALRRVVDSLMKGEDPLADAGFAGIFATEEQREVLRKVQALMCLLEGHGNVVMDRLGEAYIPQASKMSSTLRARRASNGLQRFIFRLVGLELKIQQYELGEKFVSSVEAAAGPDAISAAWQSPDTLPTMDEIRNPGAWLQRVV